jgi:choline monooxygenase
VAADGFVYEPDLARAGTLPSSWYRDPGVFDREQARVFGRTWQLVGRSAELLEEGAYRTVTVGREPVVVCRSTTGELRALSNVCRHRAGPVARGAGRRRSFQCGYHGWTYDLQGRLLTTPEFEGVQGFDRAAHGLPTFPVAEWAGLVFVNTDAGAPPLAEVLGEIPAETAHLPLATMVPFRTVDYEVACNWKVYVDNYLEGYHIPLVHPSLFREIDYAAYRVEPRGWHSRQHAPVRETAPVYGGARGASAFYYWVFPNLMLNVYPDNLQTNLVVPLSPERTRVRFAWSVAGPAAADATAHLAPSLALADAVQQEDAAICESVQRGLASSTYRAGRYSVRRENGVHHFHGLVARSLAD